MNSGNRYITRLYPVKVERQLWSPVEAILKYVLSCDIHKYGTINQYICIVGFSQKSSNKVHIKHKRLKLAKCHSATIRISSVSWILRRVL